MAEIYSKMQLDHYQQAAKISKFSPGVMCKDNVVGSFHEHNAWQDHKDYLIRHSLMTDTSQMTALDWACGPGRNIVLFSSRFKRIDGVDMSQNNLENARIYTSCLPVEKTPNFYECNGLDLQKIPDSTYDVVFSTIAFQHICCHSIRYNYMKEFNRVLKPGGFLCIQMGYGEKYGSHATAINYFANDYTAPATNSARDTRVENTKDLEKDLNENGFQDFEFNIRPSGPGDPGHPNWIYWSCVKK